MIIKDRLRNFILVLLAMSLIMTGVGYQFTVADLFVSHKTVSESADASIIKTLPMMLISNGKSEEEIIVKTNSSFARSYARDKVGSKSALLLLFLAISLLHIFEKVVFYQNKVSDFLVRDNSVMVADYVHLFDGNKSLEE